MRCLGKKALLNLGKFPSLGCKEALMFKEVHLQIMGNLNSRTDVYIISLDLFNLFEAGYIFGHPAACHSVVG